MQTEYIYPVLSDRSSPKEWIEKGKPDLIANAQARIARIYDNHVPCIDDVTDARIRAAFNIHLAS
jgi:trimethylamine--corrinoid protein Co-methyltransferase